MVSEYPPEVRRFIRILTPILISSLAAQASGQALDSPPVFSIQEEPRVKEACSNVSAEHVEQLWAVARQKQGTERKIIVKSMRSWCKDHDVEISGSYARCISGISRVVDKRHKRRVKIDQENKTSKAFKRKITSKIRTTCLQYSKQMDDDELVKLLRVVEEEKRKGQGRQDALGVMLMLCMLKNLEGVKGETLDARSKEFGKKPERERLACESCYKLLLTVVYGPPGPPIEDVIFQARSIVAAALGIPAARLFGQDFPRLGDPSYRAGELGNGRYQVEGLVKRKNVFGVDVWNEWVVILLMKNVDSARPLYLKLNGDVVFDER